MFSYISISLIFINEYTDYTLEMLIAVSAMLLYADNISGKKRELMI